MRAALAWTLYWLGDLVSRWNDDDRRFTDAGYRLYQWLMLASDTVQGDSDRGPWGASFVNPQYLKLWLVGGTGAAIDCLTADPSVEIVALPADQREPVVDAGVRPLHGDQRLQGRRAGAARASDSAHRGAEGGLRLLGLPIANARTVVGPVLRLRPPRGHRPVGTGACG